MKKLILVLVLVLVVSPVFATVTLTESGKTGTTVTVGYSYNLSGGFPRAFALNLVAAGGTITSVTATKTGESTAALPGYGIFPGSIVIDACGVVTNVGSPVAPAGDPGAGPALPAANAVVELGSLYVNEANKPANSGTLFTVVCSSGTTSLTVSEEESYRGGVVDTTAAGLVVAPITIIFSAPETVSTPTVTKTTAAPAVADKVNSGRVETFVASATSSLGHTPLQYQFTWGDGVVGSWGAATQTHTYTYTAAGSYTVTVQARCQADPAVLSAVSANYIVTREALKASFSATIYADWAAWGRPSCWAFQRHCRGDINGVRNLQWVQLLDLTALKAAYQKTDAQLLLVPNGICADVTHVKNLQRVQLLDLTALKSYYQKADAQVPVCSAATVNFWTN